MRHIVKTRGFKELYDSKKVEKSCYRACLNAQLSDEEAEKICKDVVAKIEKWIEDKEHVTSSDIFDRVTKLLVLENPEAALMYETHRDIQ